MNPINAAIIRNEILELSQQGTSIIFSTHRMESVEEICNHIALINNSKTILEGEIETIKKKFTTNNYEIIIKHAKLEDNNLYKVISTKNNTFHIVLQEGVSGKNALHFINSEYDIVSFKKVRPSIEEIFIKTVKNA